VPGRTTSLRRIALFKRMPTLRSKPSSNPILDEVAKARYPGFAEDFALLESVLVPTFAEFDLAALRDQNRYRRQKATVLVGAAVLTTLGGLQAVFPGSRWPTLVLFVVGIFLASSSQVSNESENLDDYLMARVKAERLRSLYFTYLSRTGVYAGPDRARMLRHAVHAIQGGEEIE
jgi:uncharacterized protein DUF4231